LIDEHISIRGHLTTAAAGAVIYRPDGFDIVASAVAPIVILGGLLERDSTVVYFPFWSPE